MGYDHPNMRPARGTRKRATIGGMSARRCLVGILVLVAVGLGAAWLYQQLEIDRCLDTGGRWQYENGLCEQPKR